VLIKFSNPNRQIAINSNENAIFDELKQVIYEVLLKFTALKGSLIKSNYF